MPGCIPVACPGLSLSLSLSLPALLEHCLQSGFTLHPLGAWGSLQPLSKLCGSQVWLQQGHQHPARLFAVVFSVTQGGAVGLVQMRAVHEGVMERPRRAAPAPVQVSGADPPPLKPSCLPPASQCSQIPPLLCVHCQSHFVLP